MAKSDSATRCRHTADTSALLALKALLRALPSAAPNLLQAHNIPVQAYDDLLRMAVESMRGTNAATTSVKRQFMTFILDLMRTDSVISSWDFIGSTVRQDYRVEMLDGRLVAIEAKGCGDGNNMNIWDRPLWADEFIVWSLCESLAHQPGHGVWSAIATRLAPNMIFNQMNNNQQRVDAFVYYDWRCGSDLRPCPKGYGVYGLRSGVTDVKGQTTPVISEGGHGADWMPPPSIYLFPQTVPQVPHNLAPPVHTPATCHFAEALLSAFKVPQRAMSDIVSTVPIEVQQGSRPDTIQVRVAIYHGHDSTPAVDSNWKPLRR